MKSLNGITGTSSMKVSILIYLEVKNEATTEQPMHASRRSVSILIYLEVKNEVNNCFFAVFKSCYVSILIYLEVKNEVSFLTRSHEIAKCFNPNLSGSKKWSWYGFHTIAFFWWSFNPNLSGSKKWSGSE